MKIPELEHHKVWLGVTHFFVDLLTSNNRYKDIIVSADVFEELMDEKLPYPMECTVFNREKVRDGFVAVLLGSYVYSDYYFATKVLPVKTYAFVKDPDKFPLADDNVLSA